MSFMHPPKASPKIWWSLPLYPQWGHPYNEVQEVFLDSWSRKQGCLRTFRWWQWPARYVYWDIVVHHGQWIDFRLFFPHKKKPYLPKAILSYLLQEGPPTRVYADFTPLGRKLSRLYKGVAYEIFFWGERFSFTPFFRWRAYQWLRKAQALKTFCFTDGQRFEQLWQLPIQVISPMWRLPFVPSGQEDILLIHVPPHKNITLDRSIKRAYVLGTGNVKGAEDIRHYMDASYEELLYLIQRVGTLQEYEESSLSPIHDIGRVR